MTNPEQHDDTHDSDEMVETIVVTMVDDEGQEEEFALLDMIEVNGRRYGLFAPADEISEDEDEEDDEAAAVTEDENDEEDDDDDEGILVLRSVQRGSEEDFEIIEDEAEFAAVLDHLEQMASSAQLNYGTSVSNN